MGEVLAHRGCVMPGSWKGPSKEQVAALKRQTGFSSEDCFKVLDWASGDLRIVGLCIEDGQLLPESEWCVWRCPVCNGGSRDRDGMICNHCGWLKYPARHRELWGSVGCCPKCGFSYRWDGTNCSHCGHRSSD
jgi:hypothetical protein